MSSKKKCVCDECEEWPLSMADMVTNLLCFFVLLVSMASFDENKVQAVSQAMGEAMGGDVSSASVTEKVEMHVTVKKNMDDLKDDIIALLEHDKDKVSFDYLKESLVITLRGIFKEDSFDFLPRTEFILGIIGVVLQDTPYTITIEGHTDNQPSKSKLLPSNWEVSVSRAAAVARFMFDKNYLLPKNVNVVGYADVKPIAPNKTEEGRSQNRRISIIINPYVLETSVKEKKV